MSKLSKLFSVCVLGICLYGCTNDKPIAVVNAGAAEVFSQSESSAASSVIALSAGIYSSADEVQPLLPGQQTPSFTVKTVEGKDFVYQPKEHSRPVILTFYRGGWCPYCNLHLSELRKAESELVEKGFDVWFLSIDKPELLYASLKNPDVVYSIYSDAGLDATQAFRIGFKIDEQTIKKYKGYGIDLEQASGEDHHVLPAPATSLLGTDGRIHFQYVNPDYSIRLAPGVLLAAADAYLQNSHMRMQRK